MERNRLEDQAEKPRLPEEDAVSVDLFSKDMKRKLLANVHKKHWTEVSYQYLLMRLKEEVAELEEALDSGLIPENIINESADVGNFAMMIADKARNGIDDAKESP